MTHHPAVAERAQVLRRVEREAAGAPEGPRGHPVLSRADRLRGVLEEPEPVARGERAERAHVGESPEEVHGQDADDRLGRTRDGVGGRGGIEVQGAADRRRRGVASPRRGRSRSRSRRS